MKVKRVRGHKHAIRDLCIIAISVVVATVLARYGFFSILISYFEGWNFVATFVSGMFFTSLFTIAPASIALAELSEIMPAFSVILWGATGAVIGDFILF